MEEDGTLIEEAEKVCRHSLPLIVEGGEDVWCSKTCQICYLHIDEECSDFEPIQGIV